MNQKHHPVDREQRLQIKREKFEELQTKKEERILSDAHVARATYRADRIRRRKLREAIKDQETKDELQARGQAVERLME